MFATNSLRVDAEIVILIGLMVYYIPITWDTYARYNQESPPLFDYHVVYEECMDPAATDEMCYTLQVDLHGVPTVIAHDLQELWQQRHDTRSNLRLLHESEDSRFVWFATYIPNSSACCGVVAFAPERQEFIPTDMYIDQMIGDTASPTGRWYAALKNNTTISVVDLTNPRQPREVSVSPNETVSQTRCGYAGSHIDVMWVDDSTLQYGVYAVDSFQDTAGCDHEFIRYETIVLE